MNELNLRGRMCVRGSDSQKSSSQTPSFDKHCPAGGSRGKKFISLHDIHSKGASRFDSRPVSPQVSSAEAVENIQPEVNANNCNAVIFTSFVYEHKENEAFWFHE